MADKTGIEWTDATWNPVRGCTKVSAGCDNCYAMTVAHRFSGPEQPYEGLTRVIGGRGQWNGKVMLVENLLDQPLRWTRPRRIFVNSMSDLFHPGVPDDFIDQVFAVMAVSPEHTFQVLTKRPERMQNYVSSNDREIERRDLVAAAAFDLKEAMPGRFSDDDCLIQPEQWPLRNVWLGVSVEDQATADERIPLLLDTPAAIHWLSCEPLLGPVDLFEYIHCATCHGHSMPGECVCDAMTPAIDFGVDWVVAGGESGPGSRPMHPDWPRSLRDQCQASGVPFLFKQWGDWRPSGQFPEPASHGIFPDGTFHRAGDLMCGKQRGPDGEAWSMIRRVGKREAGRQLDGEVWDQYPDGS